MVKSKSYIKNQDGNFAIMFGIIVSLLVVGVAIAVDASAMHKVKEELQSNLDGATLAAVIEVTRNGANDGNNGSGNDENYYKAIITKTLAANGYDLDSSLLNVVLESNSISVQTTKKYDLQFGGVINKSSVDVFAATKVALPSLGDSVEIALVLDNTESMNQNDKLTALRVGANNFIDAIEESNSGSKIAIVPFARYVDVGEDKRGQPWLEVPAEYDTDRTWQQATHTGGTCHIETQTRFVDGFEEMYDTEVCTGQTTTYEPMSKVIESRWEGCVGVRPNNMHMSEGPYTTAETRIPGLLHKRPREVTGLSNDVEAWCPRKITALTDDYDSLRIEIAELYGTDYTYIPIGLNWGRRILSPEAPFTETDIVNPKRKIMVIMTDGKNSSLLDTSLEAQDELEAPPYVRKFSKSEQEDGVIAVQANADSAALCETIKDEGIELYTIAFQVNDSLTHNLLRSCASSAGHYYSSESNEALVQTFTDISDSLGTEIRLIE